MTSDLARNLTIIESTLQGDNHNIRAEEARGAVLDCIIVLIEAADELQMLKSAEVLELAADIAFLDAFDRAIPFTTLVRTLRLSESINKHLDRVQPMEFHSNRSLRELGRSREIQDRKSA